MDRVPLLSTLSNWPAATGLPTNPTYSSPTNGRRSSMYGAWPVTCPSAESCGMGLPELGISLTFIRPKCSLAKALRRKKLFVNGAHHGLHFNPYFAPQRLCVRKTNISFKRVQKLPVLRDKISTTRFL